MISENDVKMFLAIWITFLFFFCAFIILSFYNEDFFKTNNCEEMEELDPQKEANLYQQNLNLSIANAILINDLKHEKENKDLLLYFAAQEYYYYSKEK